VVLPLDDYGNLITDYEEAVEYLVNIERNDSRDLLEWIDKAWRAPWVREAMKERASENGWSSEARRSAADMDLDEYLAQLRVGPGESNEKVADLVWHCFRAGVRESEVLEIVERVHSQGRVDGTVTCNDGIRQWRSKAKSHIKRIYSRYNSRAGLTIVPIYSSYLDWIDFHARSEADRVFLATHLWTYLSSPRDTYFISRPKGVEWGEEWGMTDGWYRGGLKRYTNDEGIIKVVKKGQRGAPRPEGHLQATEYALVDAPLTSGVLLGEYDIDGFLELVCKYIHTLDPVYHPPCIPLAT
jgi:hypothetical protein